MIKEKHSRGCVYSLQYHLVWCIKSGKEILSDKVKHTLDESFNQIAHDNCFDILEIHYEKNFVHLVISCNPKHSIPNTLKALKGASAKCVFKNHTEIKEIIGNNSLWYPSYYVSTNATSEQIYKYVKKTIDR